MNKNELKSDLLNLRKGILSFQEDRKMKIINVPSEKVKIDKKYYEKHDLENKPKLKSALYGQAYSKASDKIKKQVYNYKSGLKMQYGQLEGYIKKIGLNPQINQFNCYDAFFLNDNWNSEELNYKSIVSDLDIIIGKLDNLDENQFKNLISTKNKNYWKILNPLYWIIVIGNIFWEHKVISGVIIFLIGIIITILITDSIKPLTDIFTKPISNSLSGSLNK